MAKKDEVKKPKKKRIWLRILIPALIVIVLAAIPFYYTASSVSCGKCHSMDKYYKSWQKSLHGQNGVACGQCHFKPGIIATTTYRIAFYRELFAEMFDLKLAPWGATAPGGESCTRQMCHSANRLSSRTGEIKVNHKAHSDKARIACAKCHNGVTHPGIGNIGTSMPPQKQCMQCHKRVKARCSFCHTEARIIKGPSPHK